MKIKLPKTKVMAVNKSLKTNIKIKNEKLQPVDEFKFTQEWS